jgi:hypothetical protein
MPDAVRRKRARAAPLEPPPVPLELWARVDGVDSEGGSTGTIVDVAAETVTVQQRVCDCVRYRVVRVFRQSRRVAAGRSRRAAAEDGRHRLRERRSARASERPSLRRSPLGAGVDRRYY